RYVARTFRGGRLVASARRQSGSAMNIRGSFRQRSAALERLRAEPRRFTFDAVVRILTFFQRRANPAEAVRFTADAGSSFLGAEVTEVKLDSGAARPQVTEGVITLTGPAGVIPRQYSEAALADQRSRSFSLTDFLDVIAQRMVAAFASAGAKYRPHRAA